MYLCSKEHSLFQALHKSYNSPNDSFSDAHKYEFFLLKHFTLPYLLANNIISDILDLDPGTKSNASKMYSRIQSNNPPSLSKHWTPGGSVATLPRNGPKTYSIINQTNLHLLITGSIDLVTMITKLLLVLLVYVIVVYSNLLLRRRKVHTFFVIHMYCVYPINIHIDLLNQCYSFSFSITFVISVG